MTLCTFMHDNLPAFLITPRQDTLAWQKYREITLGVKP